MPNEDSIGIVETRYFTFAEPPGEMPLDCGRRLGPITLVYETYGTLNADKSNAVLIVHALSGDAHAAGYHAPDDPQPGWWDSMIGPGKGFDTDKYFVICSNVIGGCQGSSGPASLDPATGKPYGLSFPIITIADMVRAQRHLVEHLGIDKLLCVAGGSMGGMQALEWAAAHPDRLRSAIVIASTAQNSAQSMAFDAVGRHAIQADPAFEAGDYYGRNTPARGLSIARMLGHITYLSDESMRAKFGRTLRDAKEYSYDFGSEFSVETYLDYKGSRFVDRFDANSYLYITKAINYFDLPTQYGTLDEAMARVQSKLLVLSYSSDWLFPPYQSEDIVYALTRQRKDVTYCNIESQYGHDAFLLEVDVMKGLISGFLAYAMPGRTCCSPGAPCPSPASCSSKRGAPRPQAPNSIYDGRRVDHDTIVQLIDDGARVLDIGCGDGELLCKLIAEKSVRGMGLELDQENLVACVERGISVVHADVDKGLSALPDQSFDYVILSMTLQVIQRPEFAISEMLRVGRRCVVSFPNFGHWKVRCKLLALGRAPVTRSLPFAWHTSPNRHVLSIKDFRRFCCERAIRIEKEIPLSSRGATHIAPNLLADEAVFVIAAGGRA